MHGDDFNPGKSQPFMDAGKIFHVARQAVQLLDHQHLELARLSIGQHSQQAVASDDRGPRLCRIRIERAQSQTIERGKATDQGFLILDRAFVLQVCAVAAVSGGAAGHGCFLGVIAAR
ncbi:hypothetical protein V6590_09800 [Gemmobacter sp. JM10B15]|uniref:Uncharacterized protein n=1 Tax=Gemmobacter denitrificans TaxID=3123040 RepID=A0ABU8BUS2_9RHOB